MLPAEIRSLILDEQRRQGENFINTVSVECYVSKIEKNAEFICHFASGECIGFVAYYCNDPTSKNAFVTLLLVSPEGRGKGVARGLMKAALCILQSRGFERCSLEVKKNNCAALRFYESLGFISVEERKDSCVMLLSF